MNIYDAYAKKDLSLKNYKIRIKDLEEENKRLQSTLDYANRDREDMHNKIIELGNKRESQRNMNYKLRKENKTLKANVEFLHSCLDDRDKSIEIMKEKLNKLEDVKELLRKIVMDLTKLDKLKKIVFKDDADLED